MRSAKRVKPSFRPAMVDSTLESRVVLSGATTLTGHAAVVYQLKPSLVYAELGLTPPPAAPPISPALARELAAHKLPLSMVRKAFRQQIHVANQDLRTAIQSQIGQLYANGTTPTAQQLADFQAGIAGAVNATALRLSTQAALLPRSSNLITRIQNSILGTGANSLATRLTNLAQSGRLSGTTGASSAALSHLFSNATRQGVSNVNTFFNATPVTRLSVNSSGQHIPLEQFMGSQLVHQVGNTLGLLAQSFPGVANSILFPNGTTGTPSQAALSRFTTAFNNAVATAAFQLGSGLSLFPLSSSVVSQLVPLIFGSGSTGTTWTTGLTGTTGTTGTTALTGTAGSNINMALSSIPGLLQSLLMGGGTTGSLTGTTGTTGLTGTTGTTGTLGSLTGASGLSGLNSAISSAFGNVFSGLASPLGNFFGVTTPSSLTLPTSGFTSLFGSPFMSNSFFGGFNSGFSSGTTPGFIGFGAAPTSFNSNFGTGFNNFVSAFNQNLGLVQQTNPVTGTNTGGSIIANPVTGTSTGTPITPANPVTGTSTGTPITPANPVTGTTGTPIGTSPGLPGTTVPTIV
jgi:hypothetical protein